MIDAKELRIGSHISVRGVRCRIESIQGDGSLVGYITPQDDWEATDPTNDWIEPIPITEELLTDIGFKKCLYGEDFVVLEKLFGDYICDIGIQKDRPICTGLKNYKRDESLFGYSMRTPYLHILENFIYLMLHKELIKE